jgi:ribose/xylose/arabinose/galactoside ABC-type transport system permease subunit
MRPHENWNLKWCAKLVEAIRPLFMLFVYSACVFVYEPGFFSPINISSVIYYACLSTPVLLGVFLLVVLGQFDLSIGAVAALSGTVMVCTARLGWPLPVCILAAFCVGALCGSLNWLLITQFRIPALVGTLIIMSGARAAALGFSQGQVMGGLPKQLSVLTARLPGLISPIVPAGFFFIGFLWFFSRRHFLGRQMHQVGSNREAAVNNGINVSFLEWIAFVTAGIGASVVGLLQSSRTLSASPLVFSELPLECIAACVIGGARFSRGSGHPVGAFCGLLIVVASANLVVLAGVGIFWRDLAIALVLLAAVLFNRPKNA